MEFLEAIESVAEKLAPGRAPAFTEIHVIKVLETLSTGEPVGRIRLSRALGLGEGETRTLIKHLRNKGIIEISGAGVTLSPYGEEVFSDLRSEVSEGVTVPNSSLTVGSYNMAVLVGDVADFVECGLEERDAAIKAGARGATTLVFRDNRLAMPGVSEDVFQDIESIHKLLLAELRPEDSDVVIIGSADDKRTAEFAAKTAALKLLKSKSG